MYEWIGATGKCGMEYSRRGFLRACECALDGCIDVRVGFTLTWFGSLGMLLHFYYATLCFQLSFNNEWEK
ncbi:Delta(7)-sterol 5(6)-desaturase erg31 [Dirofilaria immitis]